MHEYHKSMNVYAMSIGWETVIPLVMLDCCICLSAVCESHLSDIALDVLHLSNVALLE